MELVVQVLLYLYLQTYDHILVTSTVLVLKVLYLRA